MLLARCAFTRAVLSTLRTTPNTISLARSMSRATAKGKAEDAGSKPNKKAKVPTKLPTAKAAKEEQAATQAKSPPSARKSAAAAVAQENKPAPSPAAKRKAAAKPKPEAGEKAASPAKKAAAKKATAEKVVLTRTPTPMRTDDPPGNKFVAVSWNVNSLRSTVNKTPELLTSLVQTYQPDLLCLQEHKLQEKDVPDLEKQVLELLPDYRATWVCSTEKKGYAGVVVFTKGQSGGAAKQKTMDSFFKAGKGSKDAKDTAGSSGTAPIKVTTGLGKAAHDGQGRLITVEYDTFYVVMAYVPNAGEKLVRLDYRINEWEKDLLAHLKELEKTKPVVYGGDLNVAHLDGDIWNLEAKHIPTSAGTTPKERSAFGELLGAGFKDSFRFFHPEAENCYTYWSVRAGNRPWNRGLRLDYFLASEGLFVEDAKTAKGPVVHDAWIMDGAVPGGDHCPVGLVLSV